MSVTEVFLAFLSLYNFQLQKKTEKFISLFCLYVKKSTGYLFVNSVGRESVFHIGNAIKHNGINN